MLAETIRELREELMKEGEINAKKRILIKQLAIKYGLSEEEKDRIQSVQKLWMLDVALDTVITGEDKYGVLKKLNQDRINIKTYFYINAVVLPLSSRSG